VNKADAVSAPSRSPAVRIRYWGRLKGGAGFPDSEQGIFGEEYPFFKVRHLEGAGPDGRMGTSEHSVSIEAAERLGAFIFPTDSIVFAKVGAALALNRFRYLSQPSCIDNNMMGLVLDDRRVCRRYALHALSLLDLGLVANPGAVPSVNADQVSGHRLPLPALALQRAIADYLDSETARLDALVAAKERLLAILAEKRRDLITRAVTRGLDPNAPLRDSGVTWLGQIPPHWNLRRIAVLFRERDERCEPELPLLEVSINSGVVLREFADDRIETTAADFNTYKVARAGDIVFNKMRMWQGAVGVAPQDGLVSPDYLVAAPEDGILPEFAGLLFRTEAFSAECARESHGIVWDRLRLYWEGFRDIRIQVPPLDEQRAIVAHVQRETFQLDALHTATERTIALLKERRSALVTAAVTGRIAIPGAMT
jgi:type I restriction enzyme S subunit